MGKKERDVGVASGEGEIGGCTQGHGAPEVSIVYVCVDPGCVGSVVSPVGVDYALQALHVHVPVIKAADVAL